MTREISSGHQTNLKTIHKNSIQTNPTKNNKNLKFTNI